MKRLCATVILYALLTACSNQEADAPQSAAGDASAEAAQGSAAKTMPLDEPDDAGTRPADEGPAAVARQIAGKHSGLAEDAIRVLSITAVDFPSPALDCPDPDMSYAAVITPGHKAIVRAGDAELDVRIAGQSGFVCTPASKIPSKD